MTLLWIGILTLGALGRLLLFMAFFRAKPEGNAILNWEAPYLITLGLNALTWGIGGAILVSQTTDLYHFIVFMFALGLCGAAVASYSAHLIATCMAVLLVLMPVMFMFLFSGDLAHQLTFIGGLFFIAASLSGALVANRYVKRTHELGIELAAVQAQAYTSELQRIDAQMRQVDEISNAKDEFIALVNHEIRTPLHAITGLLDVLSRSTLTHRQSSQVHAVQMSAAHLNRLVNDILEFSKLKKIGVTLDAAPFDIHDLVINVTTMLRGLADAKGLLLETTIHPELSAAWLGDEARIKQVLINLMGNAIKYTDEGAVNVEVAPADNGEGVQFVIADTGQGINPENINEIFKPYTQEGLQSDSIEAGVGLGLAITQMLVELMGGSITVQSEVGVGSVFTLVLPLSPAAGGASLPTLHWQAPSPLTGDTQQANSEPSAMRILVADDYDISRMLIREYLADLPFEAIYVDNGADAVALANQIPFDIIMLDERMPGLSGTQAAERIRSAASIETNKQAPIILQSADNREAIHVAARDSGVTEFLNKPFTRWQLLASLQRYTSTKLFMTPTDSLDQPTETASLPSLMPSLMPSLKRGFISHVEQTRQYLNGLDREYHRAFVSSKLHDFSGLCYIMDFETLGGLSGTLSNLLREQEADNADIHEALDALIAEFHYFEASA